MSHTYTAPLPNAVICNTEHAWKLQSKFEGRWGALCAAQLNVCWLAKRPPTHPLKSTVVPCQKDFPCIKEGFYRQEDKCVIPPSLPLLLQLCCTLFNASLCFYIQVCLQSSNHTICDCHSQPALTTVAFHVVMLRFITEGILFSTRWARGARRWCFSFLVIFLLKIKLHAHPVLSYFWQLPLTHQCSESRYKTWESGTVM